MDHLAKRKYREGDRAGGSNSVDDGEDIDVPPRKALHIEQSPEQREEGGSPRLIDFDEIDTALACASPINVEQLANLDFLLSDSPIPSGDYTITIDHPHPLEFDPSPSVLTEEVLHNHLHTLNPYEGTNFGPASGSTSNPQPTALSDREGADFEREAAEVGITNPYGSNVYPSRGLEPVAPMRPSSWAQSANSGHWDGDLASRELASQWNYGNSPPFSPDPSLHNLLVEIYATGFADTPPVGVERLPDSFARQRGEYPASGSAGGDDDDAMSLDLSRPCDDLAHCPRPTGFVCRGRNPSQRIPALGISADEIDESPSAAHVREHPFVVRFPTGGDACSSFQPRIFFDGTREADGPERYEDTGVICDGFWPRQGDVIILLRDRVGVPYPRFEGRVELYVDDGQFTMGEGYGAQHWSYDFEPGDIVVRFGTFGNTILGDWTWDPNETVQVCVRHGDKFVTVARTHAQRLYPLEFDVKDPSLRPLHRVEHRFRPRRGDLIIRVPGADAPEPWVWELYWWDASFQPQPSDLLLRASYKSSDPGATICYLYGAAELYCRDADNRNWVFDGRDDHAFIG